MLLKECCGPKIVFIKKMDRIAINVKTNVTKKTSINVDKKLGGLLQYWLTAKR